MLTDAKFKSLWQQAQSLPPIRAAILCPETPMALEGALIAADQNSIIPVLIGDLAKMSEVAKSLGRELTNYQLIRATEATATAEAIKLVHNNEVQMIMKGSLHSDDFMRLMVQRDSGMRTATRMSHCVVYAIPAYHKLLILTDAALNTFPTLLEKQDIVQNAINLALKLGIKLPKVALLSAVETLNPRIPNTAEWGAVVKAAASGTLKGGLVEGPLSLDLAISAQAVQTKGLQSQVGGDADIIVVPNIEVGNVLMKALDNFAGALGLAIVLGAKVPLVLTSRASSVASRVGSCMLAKFLQQG